MQTTIEQRSLDLLMQRIGADVGAAFTGALVALGDDLGLFATLRDLGPCRPHELAARAGIAERYAREWLAGLAAAGYVTFDPATEQFALTPEQVLVFADPESPLATGHFQTARGMYGSIERVATAFRTGGGVAWGQHACTVHHGTATAFGAAYGPQLVTTWLPALDGMLARLRAGAHVADVGCGYGVPTTMIARAFPASTVIGFDVHEPSIEEARRRAAGVPNVSFELASFTSFRGKDYDLITTFDALHDVGDPVAAARHVHDALALDGRWMIVEPFAHDRLEDNLTPIGRIAYAASTMLCTPNALSQGAVALGAQAGEARLRDLLARAGFARIRRVAETPMHLVLEVVR